MTNSVSKSNSRRSRANGEGSVYLISSRNKWGASIKNIHGKRITRVFKSQEEAWSWIVDERKAKNYGVSTVISNPNQTLSEYLLDWVESNRNHKKISTSHFYRQRIVNQIIPHLGNIKISQISPRIIEGLISQLIDDGFQAGTIRGTFRTLSAAFNDGYRLGDLPTNPMDRVKMPTLKSEPLKPISEVDAAIIYSHAAQDPYMHARVEIGLVCGLRPGEALGLLWSDISWQSKQLEIRRQVQFVKGNGLVFQSVKQNEDRVIYLSDAQIEILQKHKITQDLIRQSFIEDEGLIFPNSFGRKLDDRRDTRMWKKLLKESGVGNYARYQMRKTAFTRLYAELRDTRLLMEYSGHTQLSTLMNSYVFPSENFKEEIRKSVDLVRPSIQIPRESI